MGNDDGNWLIGRHRSGAFREEEGLLMSQISGSLAGGTSAYLHANTPRVDCQVIWRTARRRRASDGSAEPGDKLKGLRELMIGRAASISSLAIVMSPMTR